VDLVKQPWISDQVNGPNRRGAVVMPDLVSGTGQARSGIQKPYVADKKLDSGFRQNDANK